jgi:serine/threonine-protein kinase
MKDAAPSLDAIPAALPQLGERLGAYELLRVIGRGGMATVYLGKRSADGAEVALKVLHPTFVIERSGVRRFLAEAAIAERVQSPHLIRVFDSGQTPFGLPYLVMEYLEGQDLMCAIGRGRPAPIPFVMELAWQLSDALAAVHGAGLVHRDLKPSNVFVTVGGVVKLLDFGMAKDLRQVTEFTEPGMFLGTPEYASPEQFTAPTTVDVRSDLFSFGALLYRCIAGRLPFIGTTPLEIVIAVVNSRPPCLRTLTPDVPPRLASLVARLLMKKPEARLPSAAALRDELEAIGDGNQRSPRSDLLQEILRGNGAQPGSERSGLRPMHSDMGNLGPPAPGA